MSIYNRHGAVQAAMMLTASIVFYATRGITRAIVFGSAWAGRRYRARRATRRAVK